jgi:holo-ACP synthase/triphosphoribosyl-dephospho-CoA synthase
MGEDFFSGCRKASLEDVLDFREKRVARRNELLAAYGAPLACLSLNIPGEYKIFPWAARSFREEIRTFALALEAEGIDILCQEWEAGTAGYTAYVSAAAAPETLKGIALRIEETHVLGRLFDIDVFDLRGSKYSREDAGKEGRPCIICGGGGFACARGRAHAPEALREAVLKIMETWLRRNLGDLISSAALRAMMGEAAVTPKPGLVDRANNGAHRDMDFFTFINSAGELLPWFRFCALAGFGEELDPAALFDALRPEGKMAEVLMRKATGGVNTHRGMIFCLGLLSAAYGRLYRDNEKPELPALLDLCRAMTARLAEDFSRPSAEVSHGERIYAKNGIQGIRGEVSRGFPSVSEYALPLLNRLLKAGHTMNDAGAAVLLKLLTLTEDTNIIHRSNPETYKAIQSDLIAFLASEPGMEATLEKAARLDEEFISRNISPGGSADLLGVTFFLYWLFP